MKRKSVVIIIGLVLIMSIMPMTISVYNKDDKTKCADDEIDWWPMFHHDAQNTGYSTSKAPNTSNICWTYQMEGSTKDSSPIIHNGKVYITNSCSLLCLNLFSGEKVWELSNIEFMFYESSPAIDNNKLFISCKKDGDCGFYCFNADNGSLIWSNIKIFNSCGWSGHSSPTIYNGGVYVGFNNIFLGSVYNDGIFCLDAENGEEIWRYAFNINIESTPALMDNKLYFASNADGIVYCLDANGGNKLWQFDTNFILVSSPTTVDNKVFIASNEKLYCLDGDSGDEIWSFPSSVSDNDKYPARWDLTSTPTVVDGRVYIGSICYCPYFFCLNATTGNQIWNYRIIYGSSKIIHSSPVVADGKVYFIEGEGYYGTCCLDSDTGELIWNDVNATSQYSSPAVADGKIVIISGNKVICYGAPPQLEISDIYSYNRSVFVTVSNNGDSCAANNVFCNLSIKGGMLSKINVSMHKHYPRIYLGESVEFNTDNNFLSDQFIFGIGQIDVNVTVDVENAESISKQVKGFVFGPFVFV